MVRNIFTAALIAALLCSQAALANPLQKRGPSPTNNAALVKTTSTPNKLDAFCTKFVGACTSTCMTGKIHGLIGIQYYCGQLKTGPNKKSYDFGCICEGTAMTKQALDAVIGPKPSGPVIVTASSTQTDTTTLTDSTNTLPAVTTITTTTGTQTLTSTMTVVQTVVGGTPVLVAEGTETNPEVVVAVSGPGISKRAGISNTPSNFCRNFNDACTRQCTNTALSTVLTEKCKIVKKTNIGTNYKLYCKCANGRDLTHRAINDVDGINTSTSITIVSTATATSTVTATITPTVTATTTATTTTSTISTTTLSIVAPTGYIRVDNSVDSNYNQLPTNQTLGYLHKPTGRWGVEQSIQADTTNAQKYAVLASPNSAYTNLYQLVYLDNPSIAIGVTADDTSNPSALVETCPGNYGGWIGFLDEHVIQSTPGLSKSTGGTYPGLYNNWMWQFLPLTSTPSGNWQIQMLPVWLNPDGSQVPIDMGWVNDDQGHQSSEVFLQGCGTGTLSMFITQSF